MKTYFLLVMFSLHTIGLIAQEKEESNTITGQQLESEMEKEENVVEDDSYLQQLAFYFKHPLNLNNASEDDMRLLNIVSDLQIAGFLRYRKLMGHLIDIYELQAVPGWDIDLIKKILPYITVRPVLLNKEKIRQRFQEGDNGILFRVAHIWKRVEKPAVTGHYVGNAVSAQFRYKYQYKNLLQWGIIGDKDAGETFLKQAPIRGFDFYSLHFFAQKLYKIKAIALGDYTVNMGQGLIQWQRLAFKKGSEVINIKRQGPVLRPYSSGGEYNFHRGAAITLQQGNWELTVFTSLRKLSANLVNDSIQNKTYISSILTSGYHRTLNEISDRNRLQLAAYGGNIKYKWSNGNIGLNSINYYFSLPIQKDNNPYNLFALGGTKLNNYSFDYSYTFKNIHVFGEAAIDDHARPAFITGLLASLDPAIDLALLYRWVQQGYQSLFSNAFTERSLPSNENGLYAGISIRPRSAWRLDAFMDMYRFPWLSARIDAPAYGREYNIQLTYTAAKTLEIHSRYRIGSQPVNVLETGQALASVLPTERKSWRVQADYSPGKKWRLSTRIDILTYNKKEAGFLGFTEIFYTPLKGFFSGNFRLQYFETDSYNSRIYAYENDVLFTYSVPSYYNKGFRWYMNSRIAFKRSHYWFKKLNMTAWIKIAQTIEFEGQITELLAEEPSTRLNTEVKIQFFLGWQKNNN